MSDRRINRKHSTSEADYVLLPKLDTRPHLYGLLAAVHINTFTAYNKKKDLMMIFMDVDSTRRII